MADVPEGKLEDTAENWESGALGTDEKFVKPAPDNSAALDEALGMTTVTVRLPVELAHWVVDRYSPTVYRAGRTDVAVRRALKHLSDLEGRLEGRRIWRVFGRLFSWRVE